MVAQPPTVSRELPAAAKDLLEGTYIAAFGTLTPGGRPQITAVWYLFEDGQLKLTIRNDRAKIRNLTAHPLASLFILDPSDPLHTLEVRGRVSLVRDEGSAFVERIGRKYGNPAVHSADPPGSHRYVVAVDPDRVTFRPADR
jgi:PPOX class probable F420-dependent enzyme